MALDKPNKSYDTPWGLCLSVVRKCYQMFFQDRLSSGRFITLESVSPPPPLPLTSSLEGWSGGGKDPPTPQCDGRVSCPHLWLHQAAIVLLREEFLDIPRTPAFHSQADAPLPLAPPLRFLQYFIGSDIFAWTAD